MRVEPLVGLPGYFAYTTYLKFIFGLSLMPAYVGTDFTKFKESVCEADDAGKEKIIREALGLVDLSGEEITNLTRFVKDPNGVPYGKENMKSMNPLEIYNVLCAVCLECAKIKPNDLTTADEKKN